MSDIIKVKSGSMYEEKNGYSRLVMAGDLIFVSNTAGIDYATREISPQAGIQAEKALQNIEGALRSVDASLADIVRIVTHVPDPGDVAAVAEVLGRTFRGIDPAATTLCTPLTRPDLKVEFEVTAVRGTGSAQHDRRSVTL